MVGVGNMARSSGAFLAAFVLATAACRLSDPTTEYVVVPGGDAAGGGGMPPARGPGVDGAAVSNGDADPIATDGGAPVDPDAAVVADGGDPVGDAKIPQRPEVPPGVELARGLIFYLSLDEAMGNDVRDGSRNANRAQLIAPESGGAAWAGGWRGSALRFAGASDSQIQIESSESLDTIADGFTIAFWYRRDNNSGRPDGTFLSRSAPMDRGCLYCADIVDNRLRLQINSPIIYRAELRTEQPVPTGRWVHLAFTYSQVNLQTQIFVDGNPEARGVYAHPIGPQVRPILIGSGLTGSMDEITLHSRALSNDEIRALTLGADPLQ